MRNVFIGAGFNAFGIASDGGAGTVLAEWVAKGAPPYDLWPVDIRRFGRPIPIPTGSGRELSKLTASTTLLPGRPKNTTAADRADARHFMTRSRNQAPSLARSWVGTVRTGSPNRAKTTATSIPLVARTGTQVGREHKAAREAAVLIDQKSFAKLVLQGPDEEAALQWIAANRVDKPVGAVIYTQMLNDHGGIECDLTCARTGQDSFYIVTGTGFATHDFNWIRRKIPRGMNAQLVDVTSSNAVLSLFGPNARDILSEVTKDDVSNAGQLFATAKEIGIAGCPVFAMRITYVGELGWELHLPTEYAQTVFNALHKAGVPHGLCNAGYRAIETLRLEKGYRAWASDIGPDHTPDEAGLGWAVKMKSGIAFNGREAVAAQRDAGLRKLLASFTTDGETILSGRETIYRNGERCGWLSSGGYGHTLGKSIGMGYVRADRAIDREFVLNGSYELEVATLRVPASVTLDPLYDPGIARINR